MPVRLVRAARAERVKLRQLHRPAPAAGQEEEAIIPSGPPSPPPAARTGGFQVVAAKTGPREPIAEEPPVAPVRRVFESEGSPVAPADLVKGYEYEKGRYVVLEDQELKTLMPQTSTEIQVVEFVRFQEIDPVFLETSYYLVPAETGEKPYALLLEAMRDSGYAAIGQLTMHRRDHVLIVRPGKTGLIAHTMFYPDEVRSTEEFRTDKALVAPKELDLAKALITALAQPFDPARFKNAFQDRLRKLIESRIEARQTAREEPPAPAKAIDIMDALKQSLAQANTPVQRTAPERPERKPASNEPARRTKGVRRNANSSERRRCWIYLACYDGGAMRLRLFSCLTFAYSLFAWLPAAVAQDAGALDPIDLNAKLQPDQLAGQLATKRVIFVGETHNRYDHHLNQLEIIRLLYQRDSNLAIGVEYFPQPYQTQVDDYIAGRTNEQEFLRATNYFETWGYDYRLYAPIFRYAREQHIPVRALNVPNSLPSAVAKGGMASLSPEQRKYLPADIPPADKAYRARLLAAFQQHGPAKPGDFDHFVEAQLVWDEGMAQSAGAYLDANPGRHMVVLCGAGHVEFSSGIPSRLGRRTHAAYAIVLSSGDSMEPHMADYLLLSEKRDLPPAGVLGVSLQEKNGEASIGLLSPGGAAQKAGLKKGDVLVSIDGQPVKTTADIRLAIWNKAPGDRVRVKVRPKHRFGSGSDQDIEITLAAPLAMMGS